MRFAVAWRALIRVGEGSLTLRFKGMLGAATHRHVRGAEPTRFVDLIGNSTGGCERAAYTQLVRRSSRLYWNREEEQVDGNRTRSRAPIDGGCSRRMPSLWQPSPCRPA